MNPGHFKFFFTGASFENFVFCLNKCDLLTESYTVKQCCGSMTTDPDLDPRIHASDKKKSQNIRNQGFFLIIFLEDRKIRIQEAQKHGTGSATLHISVQN
jgi:hypothetical protein